MTGSDAREPNPSQSSAVSEEVPQAIVRPRDQVQRRRRVTRLWWLTLACGLISTGLLIANFRSQGKRIVVEFQQGHGIEPGAALRFRGVEVGQVQAVKMAPDLQTVEVEIELAPGNEALAVEGSQFWVARPRIRVGQISGLETVVGARYVAVVPGPLGAAASERFVGRESPLLMTEGDFTEIRIRFPAGEGLEIGDHVRFRGISVGEVTDVRLDEQAETVLVDVRLVRSARAIARSGTQFWIERPRLDLTEIRGLETLVAGRYIATQPTTTEGPLQTEFVGLAAPPPLPRQAGSLEIELDAPRRFGLVRGAPIRYRDVEVGRVSSVRISDDAASVKIAGVIDPKYAILVRDNSKWWVVSGVSVDAGLKGVRIEVDSLAAWIRGGIAFATPDKPGDRVAIGHRFVLEPSPLPEWLDWQPRIDLNHSIQFGTPLPRPVLSTARWTSSWLGLPREKTLEGWALALSDGRLILPIRLLDPEEGAEVQLHLAGTNVDLGKANQTATACLAAIPMPRDAGLKPWPVDRIDNRWDGESMLLIVNGDVEEPMPLDASRLRVVEDGIELAPAVSFAERFQGSAVIDGKSGMLTGILVFDGKTWRICPVPD